MMDKIALLSAWVERKHAGQIKKYSGQPYFLHVKKVAEIAKQATYLGYEIGLCHDLLEDTGTTEQELISALTGFGYDDLHAVYIASRVCELTDVFPPAAYPKLSNAGRRALEGKRLETVSEGAQTVKYADLLDNMSIIIRYAPAYKQGYLQHKKALLLRLTSGEEALRQKALQLADFYLQ